MLTKINFKLYFTIVALFLFGFIFQKCYEYKDINPSVIIENNRFDKSQNGTNFIGDNKISGKFKAKNNHLGIISVRFNTHFHVNNDYLQFSIKEEGDSTWYYTAKYKVDQFQNGQYFPFGFPVIENSQGKSYQIEIQSLGGNPNKIISHYQGSQFLSKYSFSKSFLKQDIKQIPLFIFNKILSFLRYLDLWEYLIVIICSTILYIFLELKNKNNFYKYLTGNIKSKPISDEQKTIFGFLFQIFLIFFISLVVIAFKKHTETSEWMIYEIWPIVSFFFLIILNLKSKINTKIFNKTILISTLFSILLPIFFCFYLNIFSYRYLILIGLSLIPANIYFKKNPENFFITLLINLLSIFSICAYFISDLDSLSLNYFIILIISLITLFYLSFKSNWIINLFTQKHNLKKITLLLATLLISIVTYLLIKDKPIEYHHYSFYVGPAYEISQGKSIINQVPSQYGYLSIIFISSILKNIGITFQSFHVLNAILFTIYFSLTFLIFYKITKNIFLSIFLFIISFCFQTQFSIYSDILAPSTGPLRFGIGLLIIFLLLYLPQKTYLAITSILSAISLFWSTETAIYVVPAWIFLLLAYSYVNSTNFTNFIKNFLKRLALFLLAILFIFFIIVLKEKSPSYPFPQIQNYLQFANTYKGGFGSLLVPIFGNYYPIIIIMTLGLTLSIFSIFKKYQGKIYYALYFLCIHNVALFSYFISRSHENNIINFSLFYLLELILCLKIISNNFKIKSPKKFFQKYLILPILIFIILFFTRIQLNISDPSRLQLSPPKPINHVDKYKLLKQKYNLNSNNVLIIDREFDTPIIVENNIKTILPLNPCLMTALLPNYQQKYLLSNLFKLQTGITLVYSNDIPEIMDFLTKNLTLKSIATDSADFFSLYTISASAPPKHN